MNKILAFFTGLFLLAITIAVVFLTALTYRANERSSIKSYIFQTNDSAGLRVGALQDINDISAEELRDKLIKKYVSEYFKVIPGDLNITRRKVLENLSSSTAYNQWLEGEAKIIERMSEKKMFRMVRVLDNGIVAVNKPSNYDYDDESVVVAPDIFYEIHYVTETWQDSNIMMVEPKIEDGYLYIQARFKPGIDKTINVKKHLEDGENPIGLFMFEVTSIGNKVM